MQARPLAAGLALALVVVGVAPAAPPTDGSMRVNEVYPAGSGEAFVELLDVAPGGEDPPYDSYSVISYDADGAEVASQEFTKPFPFASRTTPFVFGDGGDAPALPLAPAAGKVCFKATILTDPIHCLKYQDVPPGQSVQRQRCGRAGTAAPTRGQENAVLDAIRAGRRPCDDPRFSYPGQLKMKVIGKQTQDIDSFAVRFRLNKDGDVSARGSALVGPRRRPGPAEAARLGTDHARGQGREAGAAQGPAHPDLQARSQAARTPRRVGRALRRLGRAGQELLSAAVPLEPAVQPEAVSGEGGIRTHEAV